MYFLYRAVWSVREVTLKINRNYITLRAVSSVPPPQKIEDSVDGKRKALALHTRAVVVDQVRVVKRTEDIFTDCFVYLSVLYVRSVYLS